MSDTFQSYVFNFGAADTAAEVGKRVRAWLIAEGIVLADKADNVLDGLGYSPGGRSADLLIEDDPDWRDLAVNGVAIEFGRHVEASANADTVICPNCRHAFLLDDPQFGEVTEGIGPWIDGETSLVQCRNCAVAASVDLWDFKGGLALGDFSLCFWNWPKHRPDVADKLFAVAGMSPIKVEGRI
jgi:hypothetical protein